MTKYLLCVLLGVLLATASFEIRDEIRARQQLELRVRNLEGFAAAVIRSAQ